MTIESWEASYLILKMLEKYRADFVALDVPIPLGGSMRVAWND